MILLVNDSKDDTGLLLAFRQVGVPYPMRRLSTIGKLIAYLSGDGAYADRKKHPLPAAIVFDVDVPFEEAFVMLTWIRTRPALQKMVVLTLIHSELTRKVRRNYRLGPNSFTVRPVTVEAMNVLASKFAVGYSNETAVCMAAGEERA